MFRKERFPKQRQSKLDPCGDGPFQILEKINDNTYKLDLPVKHKVSSTFNVFDLSPSDAGLNSRKNPFEERGNYTDQQVDPTHGLEEGIHDDGVKFNKPKKELSVPTKAFMGAQAKQAMQELVM